jgi:hypothetical protein
MSSPQEVPCKVKVEEVLDFEVVMPEGSVFKNCTIRQQKKAQ